MSKPRAPAARSWQGALALPEVRRMTRAVAVLIVLALLAVAAAGTKAAEGWKRFVHPSQGFALSYPADWDVVQRQGVVGLAVVGPEIPRAGGMHVSVSVGSETMPR